MSKVTRIDEVREILLGEDYADLHALSDRVKRPDRRADDVAEVLPASIAASHGTDGRLVDALQDPLRQCMAQSVREEPEQFADALFPVMGPAIRRAVAQALREWGQQFNQAIEHSLSPRGLKWRYQAWRAGVPFGQYVLRRTLLYRVEHVYLIQSRTGRLIRHMHQADVELRDEDAVSAIFGAIQEFIRDAFSGDYTQRLRTAELGELTLWAVHGPNCVLVTVIRGVPPTSLRAALEEVIETIESGYQPMLAGWAGEGSVPADIDDWLSRCLSFAASVDDAPDRSVWQSPAALLLLIVVLVLLYLGVSQVLGSRRIDQLRHALENTPGLVVTDVSKSGERLIVRGMRDPLAPSAVDIARRVGWDDGIEESWTPFLSLEPAIVIERARDVLAPPSGVDLTLVDRILHVSGRSDRRWRDTVLASSRGLPGVSLIDTSQLDVETALSLEAIRLVLRPPADVRLTLGDDRLSIVGEAPQAWLDRVPDALAAVDGLEAVDLDQVEATEQREMSRIEGDIQAVGISFSDGVRMAPEHSQTVETIARAIREYGSLAAIYHQTPVLTVIGHSDPSGERASNIALERRRAAVAAEQLRTAGLPQIVVRTESDLAMPGRDNRTRGVSFHLGARELGESEPGS